MSDRTEQLYRMLFDVLGELTEHEPPEVIFDRIVDDFAATIEYHTTQADTFTHMLNTFRHDNPVETVPEYTEVEEETVKLVENILPEDIYGGMTDINKTYLLEDRDNLLDFMRNVRFPEEPTP